MASQHPLYDFSIPAFVRAIKNFLACMDKAEEYAKEKGENLDDYVNLRICPDMKPFSFQIQTASNSSKNVLLHVPTPAIEKATIAIEDDETTWVQLRDRLTKTVEILEKHAVPEHFIGQESKPVELFGGAYKFSAMGYVSGFALPNFYFHLTTAYDLLRAKGVPLGKLDYLNGAKLL